MKIVVGTESTWSLRAKICLKLVNIEASEIVIKLEEADYKEKIKAYSPAGLVPALIIDDSFVIHDSLSIVEYLNELVPNKLYPENRTDRALARSLCAELHAGFFNLRSNCPFSLDLPTESLTLDSPTEDEINRVQNIFKQAQLPFMFDSAGAVDAFYAVLALRLKNYGILLPGKAGRYQESLVNWSVLRNVLEQAHEWRR